MFGLLMTFYSLHAVPAEIDPPQDEDVESPPPRGAARDMTEQPGATGPQLPEPPAAPLEVEPEHAASAEACTKHSRLSS